MSQSPVFDWDSLNLGPEEDPKEVQGRLDKIYKALLDERGISYKPEKNSPGFRATPEQARQVSVMACLGLDPKDIALVMNIELNVLKLFYSKELKVTALMANAMVARTAFQLATNGRCPDMTKFWLKSQAGWKEQSHVDVTSGGKPLEGESSKDRLKAALEAAGAKPSSDQKS